MSAYPHALAIQALGSDEAHAEIAVDQNTATPDIPGSTRRMSVTIQNVGTSRVAVSLSPTNADQGLILAADSAIRAGNGGTAVVTSQRPIYLYDLDGAGGLVRYLDSMRGDGT